MIFKKEVYEVSWDTWNNSLDYELENPYKTPAMQQYCWSNVMNIWVPDYIHLTSNINGYDSVESANSFVKSKLVNGFVNTKIINKFK